MLWKIQGKTRPRKKGQFGWKGGNETSDLKSDLPISYISSFYYNRLLCLHLKCSDSELANINSLELTEKLTLIQDYFKHCINSFTL